MFNQKRIITQPHMNRNCSNKKNQKKVATYKEELPDSFSPLSFSQQYRYQ